VCSRGTPSSPKTTTATTTARATRSTWERRSPASPTRSVSTPPTRSPSALQRPATTSRSRSSRCWILDHDAVSTVIPGSTTPEHIRSNAAVSDLAPLGEADREAVADVYDESVREHVHQRW